MFLNRSFKVNPDIRKKYLIRMWKLIKNKQASITIIWSFCLGKNDAVSLLASRWCHGTHLELNRREKEYPPEHTQTTSKGSAASEHLEGKQVTQVAGLSWPDFFDCCLDFKVECAVGKNRVDTQLGLVWRSTTLYNLLQLRVALISFSIAPMMEVDFAWCLNALNIWSVTCFHAETNKPLLIKNTY